MGVNVGEQRLSKWALVTVLKRLGFEATNHEKHLQIFSIYILK